MTNQLYDKPSVEMIDENSKLIKLVPTKSLTVLSVQCLSESSGDTDKLSVDALERDYFVVIILLLSRLLCLVEW